jgi:DNA modification methylase
MPRNRDRRYISNIELCLWFVKDGAKWTFNRQNDNYDGCVLRYPSESGGGYKRYHPCQKNVKLLEELIRRHSNEGDIILDPFIGSGATGVAALNLNRNFIGIEIDENYFNIAEERIKNVEKDKILT